jgi:hypothetical protein
VQKSLERRACTLTEIAGQFCEVLDIVSRNAELYAASMLNLTPFEKGIDIDDTFAVVVDKNLQVRVFGVITADNPFPGFDVSVMEKLVRYGN